MSIYLDHAATSPMHPEVIQAMTTAMKELFGNPSSIHQYGRAAHSELERVRQLVADSLNAKSHEIIFTSGGTEGDNTALLQVAQMYQAKGRHIITTAIEHPAVLETARYLEGQGFEVTYLPVDRQGQLHVTDLKAALRDDTILVSIMAANNETGNVMPLAAIGALLKEHPALFHTDAVQAYGNLPLDVEALGIDLLSVSAHKINGPKGVGFLYKRDSVKFSPLFHGGEQEEKRRAGTENLPGLIGLGAAVQVLPEKLAQADHYRLFQKNVLAQLDAAKISYEVNGASAAERLPHVLNLRINGVNNQLLLMNLDLQGIAISTGSACTAGTVDPSHVLTAMYGADPAIQESIRISFGLGNDTAEVAEFAEKLVQTIQTIQKR